MRPAAAVADLLADLVAVFLTTVVALTAFASVYSGQDYLVAGCVGGAIALVVALVATWRGWLVFTAVAVGVLGLTVCSGPIALPQTTVAGVVPTGATVAGLSDVAIGGWRGLLTASPPVSADSPLVLVAYVGGFLAALISGLLCARTRIAAAAAIGPGMLAGAGLLIGTARGWAWWWALSFGGCLLVAARLRQRRFRGSVPSRPRSLGDLARGVGVVVVAASMALAIAWASPWSGAQRYVVRDHIELPFDPNQYPSPLAGYRSFEINQKAQTLFTVTGLAPGTRLTLAVLDDYDGVVWKVADSGSRRGASGIYERAGAGFAGNAAAAAQAGWPPELAETATAGRTTVEKSTVEVSIAELGGVWIPLAGHVTALRFDGPRGRQLMDSVRYNRITATAVLARPAVLRRGDVIRFDTVMSGPADPVSAAGSAILDTTQPALSGVPEHIELAAQQWAAGATDPYETIMALLARLRAGAFSDGTQLSGAPSWSGHSAGRIREFLSGTQLVGDAEQYAATLALMLRKLSIPARVVLGVVPPTPGWTGGEVSGAMVSAWVEVPFAGLGWVPFDPTPPITNKPQPPRPLGDDDGTTDVVFPPSIAKQPPPRQPQTALDDSEPGPSSRDCRWCAFATRIALLVGVPLSVVAGLVAAVIGVKWLRRRRRRGVRGNRERIAAGWAEVLDRMRDLRIAVPCGATRQDVVRMLHSLPPASVGTPARGRLRNLAAQADLAIFGPDGDAVDGSAFWSDVDATVAALASGRPWWHRTLAALNPITVRRRGGSR